MLSLFIAYEPRADYIDITAFQTFIENLPHVISVQENVYMVKTEMERIDFDNQLFEAAGSDVRFIVVPAGFDASFWNARPGAIESVHRLLSREKNSNS